MFSVLCMGMSVPLRVVHSSTGLLSKRCAGIGFLSRADRKIRVVRHVAPHTWLVSNFLMRPASSLGAPERSGTPSRHSRGIDTPVAITRGEGAQMKWFREPRCSFRVRPVCRGILRLHQGCQVPFRTSRQNVGLLLSRCSGQLLEFLIVFLL